MKSLYGGGVCARDDASGCTLTAPAAAWMAVSNAAMDGGHCFGMATLAALIFDGRLKASDFGARSTNELKDDGVVQSEIAKFFVTQGTDPEQATTRQLSVAQAVEALKKAWAEHVTYVLGIDSADKQSGHAVTPVALRQLPGGLLDLVIYDNNYPGMERTMRLDPKANTWSYNLAPAGYRPILFEGSASNLLELSLPTGALQQQDCPFCRASEDAFTYVMLDPESARAGVATTVTDLAGRKVPGVERVTWDTGDDDNVLLRVPRSAGTFRVSLVGSAVKAGSTAPGKVTLVGPARGLRRVDHGRRPEAGDPGPDGVCHDEPQAEGDGHVVRLRRQARRLRPSADAFENYGNEKSPVNLTSAAMTTLFGDKTCARVASDGCTLTAPAAAWLAINNAQMNGGHCFGMAAAAALLFTGAIKPDSYGSASTYGLKDEGKVQELIARLFVTQATEPEATSATSVTVAQAISTIRSDWLSDKLPLLAIRTKDGSGGHAVTPIAFRDLGAGKTGLVVYDNNFPGQERLITLDPTANTWSYITATDPSQPVVPYAGDAKNQLTLFSTSASLGTQECPFCRDNDSPYVYVVLNPESAQAGISLSVTDVQGKPLAGVTQVPWLSDAGEGDLLVRVPTSAPFRVEMKGTKVKAGELAPAQLTVIGAGWSDSVTSVQMSPGESDSITVDPSTGDYSYASTDAESPILGNTVEEGDRSYSFLFKGASIDGDGGSYSVSVDQTKHTERIASVGTGPGSMQFVFERIDGTSTQTFSTDTLAINSGQALVAEYGAWKGDKSSLSVGLDTTANGSIDRKLTLQDS